MSAGVSGVLSAHYRTEVVCYINLWGKSLDYSLPSMHK